MAEPTKGKRQVAKLSKRQLAYEIGRNVLTQISNLANGVRDLVEKGKAVDQRTGQPMDLRCTPDDIRRYWTPEQSSAIDEFIANFAIEPELPPAPPAPPGRKRKGK